MPRIFRTLSSRSSARGRRLVLCALAAVLAAACGDRPTDPPRVEVRVSTDALALQPCETRQLEAEVTGTRNTGLAWKSSDPRVASVSDAGLVNARAPGQALITAAWKEDASRSASVPVTVLPASASLTVSGAATDTIDARLAQPLTATVQWAGGCAAPNVLVRFASPVVSIAGYTPNEPALRLGPAGEEPQSGVLEVRTDSLGHAAVDVRLGRKVGTFTVWVGLRGTTTADSALFTIRPGAPHRLLVEPRDTAVYANAGYPLRVRAGDRWGNVPAEQPTVTSRQPQVASVEGVTAARARQIGRAHFIVQAGAVIDSAGLSVVPRGTIAASRVIASSAINPAVILSGLDGSGYRVLYESTRTGFNVNMAPSWHPSGARLVFADVIPNETFRRLLITDDLATTRTLISGGGGDRSWPAFSPDGGWIYFAALGRLSRVRVDGSGEEDLVENVDLMGAWGGGSPSPSPDGTLWVFSDLSAGESALMILDPATRAVRPLGVPGHTPRWSPRGDRIAYIHQSAVWTVRPDGTDPRLIAGGFTAGAPGRLAPGVEWSPDGAWLLVRTQDNDLLHLVHLESRLTLPLPFTAGLGYPAWRPGSPEVRSLPG